MCTFITAGNTHATGHLCSPEDNFVELFLSPFMCDRQMELSMPACAASTLTSESADCYLKLSLIWAWALAHFFSQITESIGYNYERNYVAYVNHILSTHLLRQSRLVPHPHYFGAISKGVQESLRFVIPELRLTDVWALFLFFIFMFWHLHTDFHSGWINLNFQEFCTVLFYPNILPNNSFLCFIDDRNLALCWG